MDKAGNDEEIDNLLETELFDSMREKLASVIGDHRDLEVIARPERSHEFHHFRIGLGLCEHEGSNVFARERAFFVKEDPIKIFV